MEWPPDFSAELDRRLKLEHKLTADRTLLEGALLQYAQSPVDFISDCVYIYEPRNANTGEPVMLPVVLFPRQREFIARLHNHFTTKTSAPVEKSRDSGATWMSCAFAVWVWLFHPGSTVGFGSRKEILVDRRATFSPFSRRSGPSSGTCRTT
jgi:phage terminase large subunit